ncbi:YcjF family protein [Ruixingdingia sedimenti]|uniref:TIGR01620 family protein n=1 Tax=Ruixingdingia sedimenti TaxID=3073604 RepID=A0ABU1FCE2_9RHOB|nr:TIGR01620 family protein [Xinfangfangia sp. LG-4]MDR5654047.1 TIGR01620 family protein [Xinfangfangia sp. LG-4]
MTDPRDDLNRPIVVELDEGEAPSPALAPPVPDGPGADGAVMQRAMRIGARRGSAAGRFFLWALGALFTFVISVAAWDYVWGLVARNAVLGAIATVLLAAVVIGALVLALREAVAFSRIARIDGLRARAAAVLVQGDLPGARAVLAELDRLYAGRPESARARQRLAELAPELLDADAILSLAETELLAPLDRAATAEIEAASRAVAATTALVPLALADVAVALGANLRMIRRIAEIYGGRAGSFGSWRLMRRVFTHLLATGAVAVGDDLISSVAGGGALARLSRRFGEGVVNGALTARVGIAALEVCRPLPFAAMAEPRITAILGRSLTGLFDRTGRDGGPA